MAMCEKCGKNGYTPYQMAVDPIEQKFLGPCCKDQVVAAHIIQPPAQQMPPPALRVVVPIQPTNEVEYGLEVSNKIGVHAYVNYQGLRLTFEKSPEELKDWAQRQGLLTASVG